MDASTIQIVGTIVILFGIGILFYEFRGMREDIRNRIGLNNEAKKIQLQAFEKLTLFADRASLKNVVLRTFTEDTTAQNLQISMIDSLNNEYDYNVSQQIYVSPEMWTAISKLKEQNIFIINQIGASMPTTATAKDLCKGILEFSNTENADISKIVLHALQFEAKKIM